LPDRAGWIKASRTRSPERDRYLPMDIPRGCRRSEAAAAILVIVFWGSRRQPRYLRRQ
jgi:hypothetical protein